jgi:signal transduction histidine kinase
VRGVRSPTDGADRPDLTATSRRVDGALVATVAVAGLVIVVASPVAAGYRHRDTGAVVMVLAAAASLWWWRTRPMAALLAGGALVVINSSLGYPVGVVQYPPYFALGALFASAPRSRRWWGVAATAAAATGYAIADRARLDPLTLVGVAVAMLVASVLGDGVRSRRELAVSQRAAAELREREHLAAVERLVLEERARLALELHDSLGHAINVMVMQAGVGRHVFDERPQFAREALEHVEGVGRVALGELDAVLRVLRPDDDRPVAVEPAPADLAGLDALCERIRDTGRDVVLRLDAVDLAPSTQRATYRIVQEALTNAARHTPSGRISVSVAAVPGSAVVTVHNAGPRPSPPVPGRGLVGMRERAQLEGGHLEYGPVPDGFQVRATLPVRGTTR